MTLLTVNAAARVPHPLKSPIAHQNPPPLPAAACLPCLPAPACLPLPICPRSSVQSLKVDTLSGLIEERDREVSQIVASINELAQIMKDLSVLVIDQGTILDRIDYNMEQVGHQLGGWAVGSGRWGGRLGRALGEGAWFWM